MQFADAINPTEAELRAWAAEPGASEPTGDWELVLSWGMERGRLRIIAELAADGSLPHAKFFLRVLYEWAAYVCQQPDFESWRPLYDSWLDQVRGVRDPAVKQWRHHARLIFQGLKSFDSESWWSTFPSNRDVV